VDRRGDDATFGVVFAAGTTTLVTPVPGERHG
jgi:hypothetical protein